MAKIDVRQPAASPVDVTAEAATRAAADLAVNDRIWVPAGLLSDAGTQSTGSPSMARTASHRLAVWTFDAASEEELHHSRMFPTAWGSFYVDLKWFNTTTDAGDVRWVLNRGTVDDGGNVSSFSLTSLATDVTAGSQNIEKTTRLTSSAIAIASGVISLALSRDATHANDTKAGDASVIGLLLTRAS